MTTEQDFILDLATVLGVSAVGGYLANQLRQPVLIGYLISGLVVGPFSLKLLNDSSRIQALAEIGVAFLLFALGVEFSLAEFKRVRNIALQGSLLQIGLTTGFVAILTLLLGWVSGWSQGIFLGAVLSLSSTAVVLKTLTERGETNTPHGQVMLAILIAQDLALGFMLAMLPVLNQPANLVAALGVAALKIVLFLLAAIVVGAWVVPHVLRHVSMTGSSELFLLAVIALCLGVALVTQALGLSIAMGAFVAGLMISEIDYADHALSKVLPLRDTFACLFFASIGMLVDPWFLWENFGVILGLVALVMIGKAAIILPIVSGFRYSFKTALITSFGLNQIGEFSFVLSVLGRQMGLIEEKTYLLLLGTTAITLLLTPIWLNLAPYLAERGSQATWLRRYFRQWGEPKDLWIPEYLSNHVVVAGYGRVGQVIVNILRHQGYEVLVIENSEAARQQLRNHKIPYIFGDADSELVLEKTHLHQAKALAIALPDPASARLLLKHALTLAPGLDVIARSHTDQEVDALTQIGAKEVVQPEFEAALELGSHLLSVLGEPEPHVRQVIKAIRVDRYRSIRPDSL
jgi:CPA2 family monovalent cation:H+ antiporter-2